MKTLRVPMVHALYAPLVWVTLLIVELTVFSHGRAQSFLGRLFEDFVFLTSFLFYKTEWGIAPASRTYGSLFFVFALQFFFWWLVAFLILLAPRLRKK